MNAWLDRVAADLLDVEHDLRATLRIISRGGKPPRLIEWHTLKISLLEARTLLRGAMPAPIATTRLREPHARLVAALSVFAGHLVRLNDPLAFQHRPEIVLDAATTLIEELRLWHHVVRWRAACSRARVKIPVPPLAITAAMRLQPGEQTFSSADLPNPFTGRQDYDARGASPLPSQERTRRELRAQQAELDLRPPPSAEVLDLRQLRLHLHQETTHAPQAA